MSYVIKIILQEKMENINSKQNEEKNIELEDQFILRLPSPQAEAVRNALRELKPKKFKKFLTINLHKDRKEVRKGTVKVKKQQLHAKLVDLPCVVENYKTVDKTHLFKTADICQMLICQKEEFHSEDEDLLEQNDNTKTKLKKHMHPHGIAPPLKNVRKQRFRKVLRNKENLDEVTEIEKEILWLLRADNEAVSTRFEVYYEKPTYAAINECTIFGEVISDSDSTQETPLSSAQTSASDLNETLKTFTSE